jgi:hypothetical protein
LQSTTVAGPEVHLLVGGRGLPGGTRAEGQETFAIQASYLQELSSWFAGELTYRNEGHIEENHRDGIGALLWGRFKPAGERLALGLGIGPEIYFNTKGAGNGDGYTDAHGLSLLGSAGIQLNLAGGAFLEARFNRTLDSSSFQSESVLTGVGYRLTAKGDEGVNRRANTRTSFFVSLGQSIVNSFDSEEGQAFAIQYETQVKAGYGTIVSLIDEGRARDFSRAGIAIQPAIIREFLRKGRLRLRLAGGPYFNEQEKENHSRSRIAALLSSSADYRVTQHHGLYISGNRVFTTDDRDSDILLVGVAVSFQDE